MKKLAAILTLLLSCTMLLSSCSAKVSDTLDLAKQYDDKGYYATVYTDDDYISDFADDYDVPFDYIYCILYVDGEEYKEKGYFIYCTSNTKASKMKKELNNNLEDFDSKYSKCVVKQSGKTVFIGSQDVWDDRNLFF